jgi:amidase
MAFTEYADYDGLGLAELVRNKDVKPSELIEEAIGRAEKLNPRLNCVVFADYDRARAAAKGAVPN